MPDKLVCIAPMMAWTDRHCRYLHRLYSPSALLFTEMVTTGALLHGGQWHQLDYAPVEHPVALQLGGNDPEDLARCAQRAAELGYDEINLNVGCPSDRVQRGTFGACLMRHPQLVADCVAAMQASCKALISVKCRLGVDHDDSDELLLQFVDTVAEGGCTRFYLHARKAILAGLSPAQNRSIPPLQPTRVQNIKRLRPHLEIIMNGGITTSEEVVDYLQWADGVMIGRAAYQRPDLLIQLEQLLFDSTFTTSTQDILHRYREYIETQLSAGQPLHAMTRHLLHSCNGMPGARRFRQLLSDSRRLKDNDLDVLEEAFAQVFQRAA
jgi:tRNA-dihydrouridine synthase A